MPILAALPAIAAGIGAVSSIAGAAKGTGKPKNLAADTPVDPGAYQFGDEGSNLYYLASQAQQRDLNVDPFAKNAQQQVVAQLAKAAMGQGPSASSALRTEGRDEAIKTAMALSGSARGGALGGAQLGASFAGAQGAAQAANKAAQLDAQERQNAVQTLGGVLGGMRNASLSEAVADAQRKDELEKFYVQAGMSREEAALRARMEMEQEKGRRLGTSQQAEGARAAADAHNFGAGMSALGSLGSALGNMGKKPEDQKEGGK